MGNWNINIQGVGAHNNGKPEFDADLTAARFVAELRAQGHTVEAASFTHGGKVDLLASPQRHVSVNGVSYEVEGDAVSYEQIVQLSGIAAKQPSVVAKHHFFVGRILTPGQRHALGDNDWRFDVADTSNA